MAKQATFSDDQTSDEEVFFGKLTLKEVKKHVMWPDCKRNPKLRYNDTNELRIIETHSEPDLNKKESVNFDMNIEKTSLSPNGHSYSNWDINPNGDSFLEVEKMVTDLCVSHDKKETVNGLDNTFDILDYIKKERPNKCVKSTSLSESEKVELENTTTDQDKPIILTTEADPPQLTKYYTPEKPKFNSQPKTEDNLISPFPLENENFKTPMNALSEKKLITTSLKKTPYKGNKYDHIASPVAFYIKNTPVTPLVKQVRPMKPLPGTSSIPKFVKLPPTGKSDCKENINLPSVGYKSAKKIRVIERPDENKIPPTQWLKKVTSSLPKPVVLKHNHREFNLVKKKLDTKQELSFADLSLHQADVSICTQKSAFNKPKGLP